MNLQLKWKVESDQYAVLELETKDKHLSWRIGVELSEVCRTERQTYQETYGRGPWVHTPALWKGTSTTRLKWNDFNNTTELSQTGRLLLNQADDFISIQLSDEVIKQLESDFLKIQESGSFQPVQQVKA